MKTHYTLITGASQGLGKAIALEMARKHENLILVSLPNSGQEDLSNFITENYGVDVHYLDYDLSQYGNYYKISDYILKHNLKIKYLVNNAGVLSRGSFDKLSDHFILKQLEVNVVAPTMIIKLLLDNLKQSKPSGILNVSSLAGFFPLIHKQVYCGTKAYLLSFSKSLRKELKKDNISVTALCPGGLNTTTRLCYQNRIVGWITRESVLTPEEAAKKAINGMMRKRRVVIPGLINKLFLLIDKIIPQFIKDKLTEREMKKMNTI